MPASAPVPPSAAPSTPKRDRLLDTAADLFYRDGFRAVGIDTLLAEAGLAKMTLYHHFASKEELIVAALERRGRITREAVAAAVAAAGPSPRKRLQALFDCYQQRLAGKGFKGCAFIRAAGEYPDVNSPVHQAVAFHKGLMREGIETILRDLEVAEPARLARQIHLLLEGAIVTAHNFDDPAALRDARDAALALLKA